MQWHTVACVLTIQWDACILQELASPLECFFRMYKHFKLVLLFKYRKVKLLLCDVTYETLSQSCPVLIRIHSVWLSTQTELCLYLQDIVKSGSIPFSISPPKYFCTDLLFTLLGNIQDVFEVQHQSSTICAFHEISLKQQTACSLKVSYQWFICSNSTKYSPAY